MDHLRSHEEMVAYYIEKFKTEHAPALEVLTFGGVNPDHQEPTPNPYMEGEVDNENFGNIGEHCIDVGICADKIAVALEKNGQIDSAEKDSIVHRALIHDANKKFEVMRRKAKNAGQPVEIYSKTAYDTMYELLAKDGHSGPELEYIKTAGKETGHSSLTNFIKSDPSGKISLRQNVTFAEMVVHLADDMVSSPLKDLKTGELITKNSSTKYVTALERIDLSNFKDRYPFLYTEGIAFDENGDAIDVKSEASANEKKLTGFQSYADLQVEVARLICAKLKESINPNKEQAPDEFIKDLVNA